MKGLTSKFLQDPLGIILVVLVIAGTVTRENGVIPSPWDSVVGSAIALLYAYGFVTKAKAK